MTDFLPTTVSDHAVLVGGESRGIPFRPGHTGRITVRSVPFHSPSHSETHLLGVIAIRRPGRTAPLAIVRVPITQQPPLLALTLQVTDADLEPTGDWSCLVTNDTEADIAFDTTITYPTATRLEHKTATFDVGLLNLLIAEAVRDAGLTWHVQGSASDADPESVITWSDAVTSQVTKGQPSMRFHVADFRVEHNFAAGTLTFAVCRINNLDSDQVAPVLAFLISDGAGVPQVEVVIPFRPDTATITVIDSDVAVDVARPVVDVASMKVFVTLHFSGTFTASALGSAQLTLRGSRVADVSDVLSTAVAEKLNVTLAGLDRRSVQQSLGTFFTLLLRLGSQSSITGYHIDGEILTVRYSVPVTASPPIPAPGPAAGPQAEPTDLHGAHLP